MKIKAPPKKTHTLESFQTLLQPAPSPPPKKKKHTEESFQPAPTAGADTMKAVQQLLQNAFQPAPQPAPPSSSKKKNTQESFQPPPQPASPPPAKKNPLESFQPPPQAAQPAPAKKKNTLESFQPAPAPASGGWNSVSINGNGTFTLPQIGTFPLPPPGGEMKKIPLQDGKFFKIRQRPDGSYEGKFGPDGQAAPPPARTRTQESSFQPSPPPQSKASKRKPASAAFQPALTALKLAQAAFQSAPPPQPKAPERKSAQSAFQPVLTTARTLAQAAFQSAPAPSSGGWSRVSINRNGTFTLPSIGTFPLPPAGEEMKKIPLQDGKFYKIRQRADGSYEGKFGPDAPPAPAPSSGGWNSVSTNPNGTFTLPSIGSYPLPAPGETKKIPFQDGTFYKIRQRADGSYEGKFGAPPPPTPEALPVRLEDRKKDAEGWSQISVDADGMIRLPGLAQALYRPKPGQTDSVPIDARTTFRFRQGADGNVYGTFETKPQFVAPPGWQRVNVDPDGMIRLPGISQALYRPKPGETDALPLDARTTFRFSLAEDGEVYGTFETKPEMLAPPGWQRLYEDPDGMIRIPGISQALYRPKPGQTDTLKLDPKTTLKFSLAEDGNVYGTFETKPEKLAEGWTRVIASPDGKVRVPGVEQVFGMPGEGFTDHVWVNSRTRFELRLGEDGNIEGRFVSKPKKDKGGGIFGFLKKALPVVSLFVPVLRPIITAVDLGLKTIDVLNGRGKPLDLLGAVGSALGGPLGSSFGKGAQQAGKLIGQGVGAIQNIEKGLDNFGKNPLLGITQLSAGAAGVASVAGSLTGDPGLVNSANGLQKISNTANQANQAIQNGTLAVNAFNRGDVLGGLAAGSRAVGNAAGVASNFSQGETLALLNGIQSTTSKVTNSAVVLTAAGAAAQGALGKIEKGDVLGGLGALFGASAQVTGTLSAAWFAGGWKFANELTQVLTSAQVLSNLPGETLQAINRALDVMRNGGDMSTVMGFIASELGKYPQLLGGLSQGAFGQQNPTVAGLLNAVPNRDQLRGRITSAKAALAGGAVDQALGALFEPGLTAQLSEQLRRGDTRETVKKLEELYLNAKGPFGLKDVDLGQMKQELSGKAPNLVVSKFVGLFSEDGTPPGKEVGTGELPVAATRTGEGPTPVDSVNSVDNQLALVLVDDATVLAVVALALLGTAYWQATQKERDEVIRVASAFIAREGARLKGMLMEAWGKARGNIAEMQKIISEAIGSNAFNRFLNEVSQVMAASTKPPPPSVADAKKAVESTSVFRNCNQQTPEDLKGRCGELSEQAFRELREKNATNERVRWHVSQIMADNGHFVVRILTEVGYYIFDPTVSQFGRYDKPNGEKCENTYFGPESDYMNNVVPNFDRRPPRC